MEGSSPTLFAVENTAGAVEYRKGNEEGFHPSTIQQGEV